MQRPGDRPTLSRIGGSDTPVFRLVAILVGLIALAILKPWGGPAGEVPGAGPEAGSESASAGRSGAPSTSSAVGVGEPTPRPTPDPNAILCFGDGWRLVTLQVFDDRQARTWVVVQPESVAGPDDPTLRLTRLVEGNVAALGFCDNLATDAAGPARIRSAWWLGADPSGGVEVRSLDGLTPYAGRFSPAVPEAFVYGPPADLPGIEIARPSAAAMSPGLPVSGQSRAGAAGAATPTAAGAAVDGWPPGRYVFVVESGGTLRWFGVDLVWPPPNGLPSADPSPIPSVAPLPLTSESPGIWPPSGVWPPSIVAVSDSSVPASPLRSNL